MSATGHTWGVDLEEVRHLLRSGESPENVIRRTGWTAGAIARKAYRRGLLDLARPFGTIRERERRAA